MKILGSYTNGNYKVKIYSDGTKTRFTKDDEFKPQFAESIDMTITEYCDGGCPYCYAGCSTEGKHFDFYKYRDLLGSIRPYTELAVNGNDLTHPQLYDFLMYMKSRSVIVNMTVNHRHFMKNIDKLHELQDLNLIKGLGISLVSELISDTFIKQVKEFNNVVIHTINGITTLEDYNRLARKDLKILILGYKQLERGKVYYQTNKSKIIENQEWLKKTLRAIFDKFEVVSFDNLALEQLDVKSKLPPRLFDQIYMGDDAQFTFFVNLVQGYYSESSISDNKLLVKGNDMNEMFRTIRKS